jgi:hypothetical protein
MKKRLALLTALGAIMFGAANAQAQNLLTNGTLDVTYQQEIVPGFFLPKPASWINTGSRTIAGPYEDEMSSEPWAGPAPTPVTTGGVEANDWAVFFKAFSGGATTGPATGNLYQDVAATPGLRYNLTGWAGAEANFLAAGAEIALEFIDSGGAVIPASGQVVNLLPTLTLDNGQPFDYKQYAASAVAPANAVSVRSRASFIDGISNPAGGGQAFVVDDFVLIAVPEPASIGLLAAGLASVVLMRRRK